MSLPTVSPVPANGRHLLGFLKLSAAGTGILALLYFGARLGSTETKLEKLDARLAEEIPRAAATHDAIESRTDQKLSAQRELILTELRDIARRLERIERKLP